MVALPIQEHYDLMTILSRRHVDHKYSHIKCPDCGLGYWSHKETHQDGAVIYCVACEHQIRLCDCGTALTDEMASEHDSTMCKPCRVEFCKDNDMCTVCEADLIEQEDDGKIYLACPEAHVDPKHVRDVEQYTEGNGYWGAKGAYVEV